MSWAGAGSGAVAAGAHCGGEGDFVQATSGAGAHQGKAVPPFLPLATLPSD